MVPGQQYVRTGHWSSGYALVYRSASVGSIPSTGLPKFFLHFLSLDSATHRSFLHFLSLNLQKKIFISRSVYGSWSAVCQNWPLVQWICTGLQICKRRFNPLYRASEVFLHFLSLGSATHRDFLHFLSLNLQKKSCSFFSQAKTSLNEKWEHADKCTEVENFHISHKCPFRKALIDITIDHCIQITHLSVLGHKSSLRSQQAFHSAKR